MKMFSDRGFRTDEDRITFDEAKFMLVSVFGFHKLRSLEH